MLNRNYAKYGFHTLPERFLSRFLPLPARTAHQIKQEILDAINSLKMQQYFLDAVSSLQKDIIHTNARLDAMEESMMYEYHKNLNPSGYELALKKWHEKYPGKEQTSKCLLLIRIGICFLLHLTKEIQMQSQDRRSWKRCCGWQEYFAKVFSMYALIFIY